MRINAWNEGLISDSEMLYDTLHLIHMVFSKMQQDACEAKDPATVHHLVATEIRITREIDRVARR